jgi:tetratricopeptide (TPR) repeat protein
MRGYLSVGVVLVLGGAGLAVAAPDRTLDKPAFTASPGELVAAGKAAPEGDGPVVVLRSETDTSYDDQGRATVRTRSVFVIRTEPAIEEWGTLHATWHPSYQDKPTLRARVIDPAGRVTELDPALATETPVASLAAGGSSDRRVVETPLPRLQIGAIVEQQVVTIDRQPLFVGGSVDVVRIGDDGPASSTVISYSAPAASKVHHVERKLPAGVRPRHEIAHDRERWVYELGALASAADMEGDVPSDVVAGPYVGISTAVSWAAVARAYRAAVERRIADGRFALPAELPRTASIEAVAAIVAWLRHQVRSAGAGFGEVARVPGAPADTVARGFGDSADQATLLLGLLRQAGISADLVLLGSGWRTILDPDLPGLGAFDHAIVRARVGARDVWIDPAVDLIRPGQLPASVQGRRALVIADDTKGLSTTPMAAPGDNLMREVRTFVPAERGPAQLTVVKRPGGAFEAEQRQWRRDLTAAALQKRYGDDVAARFGGVLDRVTASDAGDLTTPFETTLVVKDSHRVYAEHDRLDIWLSPGDALVQLPGAVTWSSEAARVNDFAWREPHVYEVENRIAVPPGFTLPAAEPDRTRAIGTASFTERRRLDGQTLIVTFRFETGKPRLTPTELAALRAAVKELSDETVHIKLDLTAAALSEAGKPREAIAECERLIALHPAEALHHLELATVLLRAGAGQAARREARKAVAIAPADAAPLIILGWTLVHDSLGREYTYDWDRAGAIAAFQKARKLAPKHVGAAVSLARVQQRDLAGRRFEAGADLRGAAAAWRDAVSLDKTDEHLLALAQVLVRSGQFAEAEKVARGAAVSEERDRWIVSAAAGAAGAKAAIKAAGELRNVAGRAELIKFAAFTMAVVQRYDVFAGLVADGGATATLPPDVAELFAKLTAQQELKPGTADPRSAALDAMLTVLDSARKTPVFWDAVVERQFRGAAAGYLPAALGNGGGVRFLSDILQSIVTTSVEGDAGLWRVGLTVSGHKSQVYVVLDHGVAKVIGSSEAPASVGRYALRTTDARARRLLDWVRADTDRSSAGWVPMFKQLWGDGVPATHDAIMLAAAMIAGDSDSERVIPIGVRCASTHPDAELDCHELLRWAYMDSQRWSDAIAQFEAIERLRPDRAAALREGHVMALLQAGRLDEADQLLDTLIAKEPDNLEALGWRFWVAGYRGQPAEVRRRGDVVVQHPHVTARWLNAVAWAQLGAGGDLTTGLGLARRALQAEPRSYGIVNTVAALEAAAGELEAARADNWKAIAQRPRGEPLDPDWYVAGRIDEQLGLTADAIAAYNRVGKSPGSFSTYDFAQQRLAALRHAP